MDFVVEFQSPTRISGLCDTVSLVTLPTVSSRFQSPTRISGLCELKYPWYMCLLWFVMFQSPTRISGLCDRSLSALTQEAKDLFQSPTRISGLCDRHDTLFWEQEGVKVSIPYED